MQNKGIIGAVCGDIIGSAYEFHKTKDMNFKLFNSRSKFTDDTGDDLCRSRVVGGRS